MQPCQQLKAVPFPASFPGHKTPYPTPFFACTTSYCPLQKAPTPQHCLPEGDRHHSSSEERRVLPPAWKQHQLNAKKKPKT